MRVSKKKDADFIYKVYTDILAGIYSPETLDKAYTLLTNDGDRLVNVRAKKRIVGAYANYHYEDNLKELSENKPKRGRKKKETPTEQVTEVKETVDLTKSTSKSKKVLQSNKKKDDDKGSTQ